MSLFRKKRNRVDYLLGEMLGEIMLAKNLPSLAVSKFGESENSYEVSKNQAAKFKKLRNKAKTEKEEDIERFISYRSYLEHQYLPGELIVCVNTNVLQEIKNVEIFREGINSVLESSCYYAAENFLEQYVWSELFSFNITLRGL